MTGSCFTLGRRLVGSLRVEGLHVTTEQAQSTSEWQTLSPWERAAAWQDCAPDVAQRLLAQAERDLRHNRGLAWANFILGAVTTVGSIGLAAIVGMQTAQPWTSVGASALPAAAGAVLAARSRRSLVQ